MKGYGFSIALVLVLLLDGCSKAPQLDQGWTSPIKVADSKDSLVGDVILQKWHSTIIMFLGLDPAIARDVSARCFLMDSSSDNSNSWTEVQLTGVPQGYIWAYPAIDQAGDKVFFEQGYTENDQVVMNVLVGHMAGRIAVRDVVERRWITDKKTIFGETGPNMRLNDPGKRDRLPGLGHGVINGSDMYIPYCLHGSVYRGNTTEDGPSISGVFHSADSGMTWQMERVSDSDDWLPSVCITKDYYYYFAVSLPTKPGQGWKLFFARKPMDGNSWDAPKVVTKTFCNSALNWKYVAEPQDDTVHLCWLDRRHEKERISFDWGPRLRENYEIAYCRRKDSDADWSKDVILSEGMLYSYSPTMSVEGDKIVVVWAGVRTAPDWHTEMDPNDIYYVASKDGGKTWTKPIEVTDGAKDEITAGRPQVALQNGVIHLFYIQGKLNLKQESPGLTKLNQPPWPIYYQQRPFPI